MRQNTEDKKGSCDCGESVRQRGGYEGVCVREKTSCGVNSIHG